MEGKDGQRNDGQEFKQEFGQEFGHLQQSAWDSVEKIHNLLRERVGFGEGFGKGLGKGLGKGFGKGFGEGIGERAFDSAGDGAGDSAGEGWDEFRYDTHYAEPGHIPAPYQGADGHGAGVGGIVGNVENYGVLEAARKEDEYNQHI